MSTPISNHEHKTKTKKVIKDSKRWIEVNKDESIYKRDLKKRIELRNWIIEKMKNSDVQIHDLIEFRMNNIVLAIIQTHDIFKADILHSELRILDWIFYQVSSN